MFELAQIAIQIAQLPTERTRPFSFLANLAKEMWLECEKVRGSLIEYKQLRAEATARDEAEIAKLVKPKSFPVSLDLFLRLMMPKRKDRKDRVNIYRRYLEDVIRVDVYMRNYHGTGQPFSVVPIPNHQEIEAVVKQYQEKGFDEVLYLNASSFFQRWFADFESRNRKQRASKGGQSLKFKRDAEKNITPEKNSTPAQNSV